jgi:hypothetical protein
MKKPKLFIIAAAGVWLSFGVGGQAYAKEQEQTISRADVPEVVQKTAEAQATGGRIVRWEKEGSYYEAVINKDGKRWGVKISPTGKMVSKRDESKEHK